MRGGGIGASESEPAFVEGALVGGGLKGLDGSLDGVVGDASEDALDGIEACEGPLPLFHAATLLLASKLVGLGISVPSSLAMTQPLLRLLGGASA